MSTKSLPSWDLADFYQSINDPKIEKDIKEATNLVQSFSKKLRGKINPSLTPNKLLATLQEYENILEKIAKPLIFAGLVFTADSKTVKHGAFLQKMKTQHLELHQQLIFFELELIKIEDKVLQKLIDSPVLSNYQHFLLRLKDYKPHRLTEAEEKIFTNKVLTGRSSFVRLFDEEISLKKFKYTAKGETKYLGEAEVLSMLHNSDQKVRKAAADALTGGLQEELRRFTFISNTLVQDKQINDKTFGYSYPEESRHLDNEITKDVVDIMVQTVAKNFDIVQNHYHFKAKVLGAKKLYDYDRYAPVGRSTAKFDYPTAQKIVLESFSQFSSEYTSAAKKFFDNNWIDVPPRDGKRGGAFCNYTLPSIHPYILLNYTNNIKDVLTLAHELGHGIHGYLFRNNTYVNFDTTLTVAETASVFGEMLVFDNLKERLKGQERFTFYMNKVEEIFATVFRQVAMFRFEQDFYSAYHERGELTSEEISNLWLRRQKEMFGNSMVLRPDYKIWWSYIPHFLHTPFYVYAYAFGELLTLSLYAKYKAEGKNFVDKYITMLKTGGSMSPNELLKPLGVNLKDPNFWQEGVNLIKKLTEETQELFS